MGAARRLPIRSRLDADQARREARRAAVALGFDRGDAEVIALAVSELAMNLYRYAIDGEVTLRPLSDGPRRGLQVESQDRGPGIADVDLALRDGYTTGGGLGSGLPAVRRLMDEFDIVTDTAGTRIVATKWLTLRSR